MPVLLMAVCDHSNIYFLEIEGKKSDINTVREREWERSNFQGLFQVFFRDRRSRSYFPGTGGTRSYFWGSHRIAFWNLPRIAKYRGTCDILRSRAWIAWNGNGKYRIKFFGSQSTAVLFFWNGAHACLLLAKCLAGFKKRRIFQIADVNNKCCLVT